MNANNPSQTDAPTAASSDATQPTENRVSKNAARRSNAGRALPEQEQDARQQQGLLVVETLQDRCGDADENAARRQVVRHVEPSRQTLRHEQQRDADDAADEVRYLDDTEWQETLEKLEPARRRRRRARQQQHDARDERERREQPRRELFFDPAENRRQHRRLRSTLSQFVGDQRDQRNRQRQQVVNETKDDERRQQARRLDVRLQQHEHQPLEDSDTTGHVADEAEQTAARNAPRNVRNETLPDGSSTYSTAPASVQSSAEITSCAMAIAGRGQRRSAAARSGSAFAAQRLRRCRPPSR